MSDLIERARELAKLRKYATNGPWRELGGAIYSANGSFVLSVYDASSWAADKNLIAAAPEMAELLQQMADEFESNLWPDRWHRINGRAPDPEPPVGAPVLVITAPLNEVRMEIGAWLGEKWSFQYPYNRATNDGDHVFYWRMLPELPTRDGVALWAGRE